MPTALSQVRLYKEGEVDLSILSEKAFQILGKHPFQWQLEAAKSILCGKDVIIDVGTGCGKTLCFLLPLLLHETDIGINISPLSALMLEQASTFLILEVVMLIYTQANNTPISTVGVCQETIASVGKEQLYKVRH